MKENNMEISDTNPSRMPSIWVVAGWLVLAGILVYLLQHLA